MEKVPTEQERSGKKSLKAGWAYEDLVSTGARACPIAKRLPFPLE